MRCLSHDKKNNTKIGCDGWEDLNFNTDRKTRRIKGLEIKKKLSQPLKDELVQVSEDWILWSTNQTKSLWLLRRLYSFQMKKYIFLGSNITEELYTASAFPEYNMTVWYDMNSTARTFCFEMFKHWHLEDKIEKFILCHFQTRFLLTSQTGE